MDTNALRDIIKSKEEQQRQLNTLKEDVQTLYTSLWASKASRFFNSSYLFIKAAFVLLLAISLIIGASILIIHPAIVITDPHVKNKIIEVYINDYLNQMEEATKIAFAKAIEKGNISGMEDGLRLFMQGLGEVVISEFKYNVRLGGALLLALGLILLYIARLINKQRSRNRKISEAQSLSQLLTEQIEALVDMNRKELDQLKHPV